VTESSVLLVYSYPDKQFVAEKRLEVFKVCINTVPTEVLQNMENLKANINLCEKLADN